MTPCQELAAAPPFEKTHAFSRSLTVFFFAIIRSMILSGRQILKAMVRGEIEPAASRLFEDEKFVIPRKGNRSG